MATTFKGLPRSALIERFRALKPEVREKIAFFLAEHPDIRVIDDEFLDRKNMPCLKIIAYYIHRAGDDDNRKLTIEDEEVRRWLLNSVEERMLGLFVESLCSDIDDFTPPRFDCKYAGAYNFLIYLRGTRPEGPP